MLSGELALPPLTTIDFPTEELGSIAARLMLERLDHPGASVEHVFVRPDLTSRGSTARRRRRHCRRPSAVGRGKQATH